MRRKIKPPIIEAYLLVRYVVDDHGRKVHVGPQKRPWLTASPGKAMRTKLRSHEDSQRLRYPQGGTQDYQNRWLLVMPDGSRQFDYDPAGIRYHHTEIVLYKLDANGITEIP